MVATTDARATQAEVLQVEADIVSDNMSHLNQTEAAAAANDKAMGGKAGVYSAEVALRETAEEADRILWRRGGRCAGRLVREAGRAD